MCARPSVDEGLLSFLLFPSVLCRWLHAGESRLSASPRLLFLLSVERKEQYFSRAADGALHGAPGMVASERDDQDLIHGPPLLAYPNPGRYAAIGESYSFRFPAGFMR